jgi:hypothetical protein
MWNKLLSQADKQTEHALPASTFLSSLEPLFILPNPPYPFIPDIFAC